MPMGNYLPITLNIFSRLWCEWLSGKFSTTTVRDCKIKNKRLLPAQLQRTTLHHSYNVGSYQQFLFVLVCERMLTPNFLPIRTDNLQKIRYKFRKIKKIKYNDYSNLSSKSRKWRALFRNLQALKRSGVLELSNCCWLRETLLFWWTK